MTTQQVQAANQVWLIGKLTFIGERRRLRTGSTLLPIRVSVKRPERAGAHVTSDTIECTAWTAELHDAIDQLEVGDYVEVWGSLRRGFWHTETGPASRIDIELDSITAVPAVTTGGSESGQPERAAQEPAQAVR